MDVREKLVEMLGANTCKHDCCEDCEYCEDRDACIACLKESMADYLIAHGVTVQEWISVKDRLPEYEKPVMGWDAEMRDMGIVNFIYGQFFDILDMSETKVTHWMPLPQPPKGE